LRFLKSRYELITPAAFRSWLEEKSSLPRRAILLTCDDGLSNVLTEMLPVLLGEGARCLFFVTAASLEEAPGCLWFEELHGMLRDAPGDAVLNVGGKALRKDALTAKERNSYWWNLVQELSALNSNDRKTALASLRTEWRLPNDWRPYNPKDEVAEAAYRLLNRDELRQLAVGGMTVGAHTLSHPFLSRMSQELAEQEIRECRERLESYLQHQVWALAYPFGTGASAGKREMTMAERAGYACAFLNHGGGLMRRTSPRYGLPRAHVTSEMNLAEFEAHLSGFHEGLQRRVRGGAAESGAV
jgi:peptidoglycan/xylan/chitin deacetylase (PgdA/CDA1 family)